MSRKRRRRQRKRAAARPARRFFRTVGRGIEVLLSSLGKALVFGFGAFALMNSYWAGNAVLSGILAGSVAFLYALGRHYKT